MTTLTSKERLKRCYFHEELDRPAVYIRCYIRNGSDRSYDKLLDLINEKTDLKIDSGVPLKMYDFKELEEKHDEDFKRKKTIIKTPLGELFSSNLIGLRGQPGYTEKHLLDSKEDIDKYLSLKFNKAEGDLTEYLRAKEKMGDRGIVTAAISSNPAALTVDLFGSERFAMMTLTDRELLHELTKKHFDFLMELAKFYIEKGVGPFFWMSGEEYITPILHGPQDFDDFNVKYDKPIIDLIHNAGGRVHIHCHGSIKKVLPGFLKMGVDVLHPFEAPPMGDVTPSEAKEIAGDKICFEGNIQIADMYEKDTANIKKQVEGLIRDMFKDKKNLIICPTASPYIIGEGGKCYENYRTMIETVLNYGK